MNGRFLLYLDQYGQTFTACTVKELRKKVGGGRVSKIYRDTPDGAIAHVGYAIGSHWLTMYEPLELPANL